MAIYHLSAKTRKSGAGKPACQYIMRLGKYADPERYTPAIFRDEGGLPSWAQSAQEYFTAADDYEVAGKTRGKQAAAAKAAGKPTEGKAVAGISMDIAIPCELTDEQREVCARDFVAKIVQDEYGILPHCFAMHPPDADGDQRNHHLHIMLGFRPDDHIPRPHPSLHFGHAARGADKSQGGARKARGLGSWAWLKKTRKTWEEVANRHLTAAGLEVRIDCRSYATQGIEKEPTEHLGPLQTSLQRLQGEEQRLQEELAAAASREQELQAEMEDCRQSLELVAEAENVQIYRPGPKPTPR